MATRIAGRSATVPRRPYTRSASSGSVREDVGDEHGLIDLDPGDPGLGKPHQQLFVQGHHLVETLDGRISSVNRLAQRKEGDRADDDWTRGDVSA